MTSTTGTDQYVATVDTATILARMGLENAQLAAGMVQAIELCSASLGLPTCPSQWHDLVPKIVAESNLDYRVSVRATLSEGCQIVQRIGGMKAFSQQAFKMCDVLRWSSGLRQAIPSAICRSPDGPCLHNCAVLVRWIICSWGQYFDFFDQATVHQLEWPILDATSHGDIVDSIREIAATLVTISNARVMLAVESRSHIACLHDALLLCDRPYVLKAHLDARTRPLSDIYNILYTQGLRQNELLKSLFVTFQAAKSPRFFPGIGPDVKLDVALLPLANAKLERACELVLRMKAILVLKIVARRLHCARFAIMLATGSIEFNTSDLTAHRRGGNSIFAPYITYYTHEGDERILTQPASQAGHDQEPPPPVSATFSGTILPTALPTTSDAIGVVAARCFLRP
ncbi:hypothetical protein LXA43DRAFT_1101837 [Ganoderma leucocontextum]|nr:hypothetical protein LXA43DRAFT_1101837 [Ganoderma leucocontextum]